MGDNSPTVFTFRGGEDLMFINTEFEFDNENSVDYGLKLVKLEMGSVEQIFGYNRDVVFEQIPNRRTPIYYHHNFQPIAFNITLTRIENNKAITMDSTYRRQIIKWLFKKDFRDFRSLDNPSIVYKVMFTGENKFNNFGLDNGYITLQAFSMYSHAFSPLTVQTFDFSDITSPTIFRISNPSNIEDYYYPEIEFELQGASTGIQIKNISDSGSIFKFSELQTGEKIYVDNENKIIISDVPFVYRLGNLENQQFFRLIYGVNQLEITGKCILQIRSQFPIAI